MKYEIVNTPHQTIRLWLYGWRGWPTIIDKLQSGLNPLSCWGGIDGREDEYISWEFPPEYRNAIERILKYYCVGLMLTGRVRCPECNCMDEHNTTCSLR